MKLELRHLFTSVFHVHSYSPHKVIIMVYPTSLTVPTWPHHLQLLDWFHVLPPQVEYGDLEKPILPGPGSAPPAKAQHLLQQVLDKFYPRRYRHGAPPEQLKWVGHKVLQEVTVGDPDSCNENMLVLQWHPFLHCPTQAPDRYADHKVGSTARLFSFWVHPHLPNRGPEMALLRS